MTFLDLTRITRHAAPTTTEPFGTELHTFDVAVPDGWQQGAGVFGGWVMAVLVRAAEAVVPGRPLRSLTAEIPAPAQPGDATIFVEALRSGQSVTTVAARLVQKGQLQAHAVAVDGVTDHTELIPPAVTSWQSIEAFPPDVPEVPPFARHFEFRMVEHPPFRGAPQSGALGWVRLREPGPAKDAALVVAHVDAWWPAEFARLPRPRPMVTAAFSMQVVGGASAWATDAPLLHASRSHAVRDGYVTEVRELWTEAGELVALNEQTMVMVK
jgi:acyl-CoA thioesterase